MIDWASFHDSLRNISNPQSSRDCVQVALIIFYDQANSPATTFLVPLNKGWLEYQANSVFMEQTHLSQNQLEVYDLGQSRFVPIKRGDNLFVAPRSGPIIVRIAGLASERCMALPEVLLQLRGERKEDGQKA
ncbi:hypothetical protein NP233_g4027 [Leucocoprinus birnbaumii]|uniref:Uncharacterized protein n=1 Tax=Leucocoprinus birnbaumii TaxID=56174 RepID=A0AAD5YXX8_9AGAR|nr:hypothetical protein NP233_g4027 [Leucocoprinus birnbaumii]